MTKKHSDMLPQVGIKGCQDVSGARRRQSQPDTQLILLLATLLRSFLRHEGVVKMLLEREEINPNPVDPRDGCTPLFDAVAKGYEGIVKMLLDRYDINIDIRDNKGWTPPSLALYHERHKIARMISEWAAIKSDTADSGS